ncbi:MAG: 23S rRNA (guanosine(2251)-2'-O)-methyltransferase RlmB [Candidatus Aminicenantia bacterium]
MFVDNINSILEMLRGGRSELEKIYIEKGKKGGRVEDIISIAKEKGIPICWMESNVIRKIHPKNRGILAKVSPVPYSDPYEILSASRNPFIVVLDSIEDPRNFGAIIRTCVSAGADGIIIRKVRSAGITPAVYTSSAGMVEHVKIGRVTNIPRFLDEIKDMGIWVVGAEKDSKNFWFSFDFRKPVAIVFGSEGKGISRLVREKCDIILSIPMKPSAHSLNISVSVGIFLFEVLRQRDLER